jgi:MFS family permease
VTPQNPIRSNCLTLIIINPVLSIRRILFKPGMPPQLQTNFTHLYLEVAWFGILSGSAVNFLNVYATRLGASGQQLGLLWAVPAVVSLALSIPFGVWLQGRRIDRAVFWVALLYRIGYLLWIPLPWLFNNQGQIWALIGITLLMGIPLTGLGTAFNVLFGSAVPSEWRAHVVGVRNALLSLTFIFASLGSGFLLDRLPFPLGYQVVFGIGVLGGAMSTLHLYYVRIGNLPSGKKALPGGASSRSQSLRLDVWKTGYGKVLLLLLVFHLTQYMPFPLFAPQFVYGIGLTDAEIGIGTALFYLTVLIGSTQLNWMVGKSSQQRVTAWGAIGLAFYPIGLALSHTPFHYYLVSIMGGFVWAMVGGAYVNYLLERIPEDDRPAHLAWYNLVLNASVLVGTLVGPLISGWTGLVSALLITGGLRFLAGLAILKWG